MTTSRKVALLFGSEIVAAVLGWLAIKLVLLYMGPGPLGELAFALSLVGSFTFLALLGFRQAHIKRVSEGRDLGRCLTTFAVLRLVQLGVMTAAFLAALAVWTYGLGKPLTDASPQLVLTILVYYLVLMGTGIANTTFIALQESSKVSVPTLAGNLLRVVLMVGVAFSGLGALWLGYAYLVGALVALGLSLFLLRSYPRRRPQAEDFASYYRFARPLMVWTLIGTAATYGDKVVLGIFYTSEQLGAFFAVQRLTTLLVTLAIAVETLLFPQLSGLHAQGGTQGEFKARVRGAERWLVLVMVPLVAVIWALPQPTLLVLLSAEVEQASGSLTVLRLLSLAMLIRVLVRPYGISLRAIDRPDLAARVGVTSGLIAIGLNLILVPGHVPYLGGFDLAGLGAVGAAWAILVSTLFHLVLTQFYTHRELGLYSPPKMVLPVAVGAMTILNLWTLAQGVDISRWWELGAMGVLGLALFWGLMALWRQFTAQDVRFLWEAVHPGQMSRYVFHELKGDRDKDQPK